MKNELYFCLNLTENEHGVIEGMLLDLCSDKLKMNYYRELKDGHIPMYREVKFVGDIGIVRKFIKNNKLEDCIKKNPHRVNNE